MLWAYSAVYPLISIFPSPRMTTGALDSSGVERTIIFYAVRRFSGEPVPKRHTTISCVRTMLSPHSPHLRVKGCAGGREYTPRRNRPLHNLASIDFSRCPSLLPSYLHTFQNTKTYDVKPFSKGGVLGALSPHRHLSSEPQILMHR